MDPIEAALLNEQSKKSSGLPQKLSRIQFHSFLHRSSIKRSQRLIEEGKDGLDYDYYCPICYTNVVMAGQEGTV